MLDCNLKKLAIPS